MNRAARATRVTAAFTPCPPSRKLLSLVKVPPSEEQGRYSHVLVTDCRFTANGNLSSPPKYQNQPKSTEIIRNHTEIELYPTRIGI